MTHNMVIKGKQIKLKIVGGDAAAKRIVLKSD